MKDYIQTAVIFIIFMGVIPCLAFIGGKSQADDVSAEIAADMEVGIYFTDNQKLETYSLEDYLTGAVLAQMPADFEDEALKAQVVLARTYIVRRYQAEQQSPTENLHGGLISDDTSLYQDFFTEKQAQEFYGDDYKSAYKKVKAAVQSAPEILTYNGEPVIAAFHAVSSGNTESAETAWGQDIPYLQSVESRSDLKIDGVETEITLSSDAVKEKLSNYVLGANPAKWIELTANERGYVTSVKAGENDISVTEFTKLMGIPSPCFEYSYADGEFTFRSLGYGHLVGMSQYGANSLAADGKTYKDILMHYYTDCKLERI
ncbi:MAG: stage II sporulation protein D [Ruminococcus sp.]|nr:stage II sporulation protein D [Ruminococcus sp.]